MSRLEPAARTRLALRAAACADLEAGRIDAATYRAELAALRVPVPVTRPNTASDAAVPQPAGQGVPAILAWASEVRAVSSEWSASSWSAQRVVGAPDVFPDHADHVDAWATLDADGKGEVIEVGFTGDRAAAGVVVFETLNPGAILEVELRDATGETIAVIDQAVPVAQPSGAVASRYDLGCTHVGVASVVIRLRSEDVPGWNELDAVGLIACPMPTAELAE